jgi:hypothetical protein
VRRDSAGVQELRNPLRIRGQKLRKGSAFTRISETQVEGSQRRRNAKVQAFGNEEFFQVWEENTGSSREHSNHWIDGERRSAPLDFHVQEELRRSVQERRTDSCRISRRNHVIHWIRRIGAQFNLKRRSAHRRSRSEAVRSEQIPSAVRSAEAAQGLAVEISAIGKSEFSRS